MLHIKKMKLSRFITSFIIVVTLCQYGARPASAEQTETITINANEKIEQNKEFNGKTYRLIKSESIVQNETHIFNVKRVGTVVLGAKWIDEAKNGKPTGKGHFELGKECNGVKFNTIITYDTLRGDGLDYFGKSIKAYDLTSNEVVTIKGGKIQGSIKDRQAFYEYNGKSLTLDYITISDMRGYYTNNFSKYLGGSIESYKGKIIDKPKANDLGWVKPSQATDITGKKGARTDIKEPYEYNKPDKFAYYKVGYRTNQVVTYKGEIPVLKQYKLTYITD